MRCVLAHRPSRAPTGHSAGVTAGFAVRDEDEVQSLSGQPALQHLHEARRQASLHRLRLLDTPSDPTFDWLVDLAVDRLGASAAGLGLVDGDRVWRKARVRMDEQTPRAGSLCDWVVSHGRYLEVDDVRTDLRFRNSGMLASGMRAYAGAPVLGVDGLPVGVVCVMQTRPGGITGARDELERIAELTAGLLHLGHWKNMRRAAPLSRASRDLRRAVDAGEIVPFYQPIVDLEDLTTVGCEALARWDHPTRGWLSPAAFLEMAERDDLVLELDRLVLERACSDVSAWHVAPDVALKPAISVNVSSRHLAGRALLSDVKGVLDRSGLPAQLLTLELTETVLATADVDAVQMLRRLRDLGVSLALDDFGTAYSSLSYLQKFPVSSLKIDRGFVAGLGAGSLDESLVEAVLHLARRLGLDTVAEGVETAGQADVLRELGCPKAQGYLFSRPLPAADMGRWLTGGRSAGT